MPIGSAPLDHPYVTVLVEEILEMCGGDRDLALRMFAASWIVDASHISRGFMRLPPPRPPPPRPRKPFIE
jgi:hypothetical protein